MPLIYNEEGCRLSATVFGKMHFPHNSAKSRALSSWYEMQFKLSELPQSPVCFLDEFHEERLEPIWDDKHLMVALRSRSITELAASPKQIYKEAFIAAHWLRFRLYVAAQGRKGSTALWRRYVVSTLFPETEVKIAGKNSSKGWPRTKAQLDHALKNYGAVAHLWLAHMDSSSFNDRIVQGPDESIGMKPGFAWGYPSWSDVIGCRLGLAQTYYQAALAAGLYDHPRYAERLTDVWILPESVKPTDLPRLTTPDSLVTDFDLEAFIGNHKSGFENEILDVKDESAFTTELIKKANTRKPKRPASKPLVRATIAPSRAVHGPPPPPRVAPRYKLGGEPTKEN